MGKLWRFKIYIYIFFGVILVLTAGPKKIACTKSRGMNTLGAKILQEVIPQAWTKALRKTCLSRVYWHNQDLPFLKQPAFLFH